MSHGHPGRAVTFGELLLRLSPPEEERLLVSPRLAASFGGAEANVAVGLRHLGVPCDYVTRLPANPIGDAALDALKREGVGTDWVLRGGERMGIYFVEHGADLRAMRVIYDRAASAFAELPPQDVPWPHVLAGATWFHGSGITPALGAGPAAALAAALDAARAQGARVSFDLNYREALWRGRDPRGAIGPLVRDVDLLICNAAAAHAMLGIATNGDAGQLARRLAAECGCRWVAVTQRETVGPKEQDWSALLHDQQAGTVTESRRHRMRVVDRVGGGDCFAAGLIAALLLDRPKADALEQAVAAGALQLDRAGDFCRVSEREIQEFLSACT